MRTSSRTTTHIVIVHLQVPEFDAAQVQPSVFKKASHVFGVDFLKTNVCNQTFIWNQVEVITATEDTRGGTLPSERAPLQPKTAFGKNRVSNIVSLGSAGDPVFITNIVVFIQPP